MQWQLDFGLQIFFYFKNVSKFIVLNKVVRGLELGINNHESSYQTAILTRDELAEP